MESRIDHRYLRLLAPSIEEKEERANIHPPSPKRDSSRKGAGQFPWNGDMEELDDIS